MLPQFLHRQVPLELALAAPASTMTGTLMDRKVPQAECDAQSSDSENSSADERPPSLVKAVKAADLTHAYFRLAMLCLLYAGVNIVCFVLNSMDEEYRENPAHERVFHLLEFWSTFAFSAMQVILMMYWISDGSAGGLAFSNRIFHLVMFCNVVLSFVSAVLVTVDLERFETPSHELEYANEIAMSLIDLAMFSALTTGGGRRRVTRCGPLGALLAFAVAAAQLAVYNLCANGEQIAHLFEFTFELFSALVTFSFCMRCCEESDARHRRNLPSPGTAASAASLP